MNISSRETLSVSRLVSRPMAIDLVLRVIRVVRLHITMLRPHMYHDLLLGCLPLGTNRSAHSTAFVAPRVRSCCISHAFHFTCDLFVGQARPVVCNLFPTAASNWCFSFGIDRQQWPKSHDLHDLLILDQQVVTPKCPPTHYLQCFRSVRGSTTCATCRFLINRDRSTALF